MLTNRLMGSAGGPAYIEDFFQSWLSTGTGTTRTVTGPDMTQGGLSITKSRSGATGWRWVDTARGAGLSLESNSTGAQASEATGVTAFTTTGISIGADADYNTSGATYVDYLFRKQPKFFDVVTYTGDGEFLRVIDHNLQGTLGALFIKATSTTGDWFAWCRTETGGSYLKLNSTAAQITTGTVGTESYFIVGTNTAGQNTNASGVTYVAYLFAHNAGGFGLSGTDNVISCGSFTTDASGNATVNLGYEPQWVMWKAASTTGGWNMLDNMRGFTVGGADALLNANSSSAETSIDLGSPTATGFTAAVAGTNATFIYIAIRRGPMKVPTDATKVFAPVIGTNSGIGSTAFTAGFPVDAGFQQRRSGGFTGNRDRLRGTFYLNTSSTAAETSSTALLFDNMTGLTNNSGGNFSGDVDWMFRRAPGFFDEVCYTGTGAATTVAHNLGVAPELMIVKCRNTGTTDWMVYAASQGNLKYATINSSQAFQNDPSTVIWNGTSPTASVFSVGTDVLVNGSGRTYIAYLFASCPGVSKVFSYTGNGTSQTINCGFTAGARFILIKRTDSTGDWYVWDTARGIVAGNDPHLSLNTTAAEVTTDDSIDPDSTGFIVNQLAATNINVSSATYIGLAIA